VIINEYPSGDVLGEAIVKRSDYPTIAALVEESSRSIRAWQADSLNQVRKRIQEIESRN
jgi:hypothetical protein